MPETSYTDILCEEKDGVASIMVNGPEALNAYRMATYGQVTDALHREGRNRDIGAIVLSGASDRAFGPKIDSVDRGCGTAYLPRIVGEKKARELWYLCRRYSAVEAAMGPVNKVVPDDRDTEVAQWCAKIVEQSPTAIAIAKRSFNADSDNILGIAGLGFQAVSLYCAPGEAKEGGQAFREKRTPRLRNKMQ